MELILDGALFGNSNQVLNYMANTLRFPAYFGGNLDALYDCLTERCGETTIRLKNWPDHGRLHHIAMVIRDAAEENRDLKAMIE